MLACVVFKKTKKKRNIAGALSVLNIQGLYKKINLEQHFFCVSIFFLFYNFHVFFIVEVCVKCLVVEVLCWFFI